MARARVGRWACFPSSEQESRTVTLWMHAACRSSDSGFTRGVATLSALVFVVSS